MVWGFRAIAISLVLALAGCPAVFAGQSSVQNHAPAYRGFDDVLNDEAEATDPTGIHKYSEHLIKLIVPNQAGNANAYIDSLSDRLAKAEQMAREGKGHLVPEADVVRSYNDLMKKIGAPSSFYADEAEMRAFRAHSVAVPVLPALLSADRNGTNCNPGEAVYLFSSLLYHNGKISGSYLDFVKVMRQDNFRRGAAFAAGVTGSMYDEAEGRLTLYSLQHRRHDTIKLFNGVAKALDF